FPRRFVCPQVVRFTSGSPCSHPVIYPQILCFTPDSPGSHPGLVWPPARFCIGNSCDNRSSGALWRMILLHVKFFPQSSRGAVADQVTNSAATTMFVKPRVRTRGKRGEDYW